MKKTPYEYVILFLQIFLIVFFVLVLSAYNIHVTDNDFFKRSMYSENVKGLQISYTNGKQQNSFSFNFNKLPESSVFYKQISGGLDDIRRGIFEYKDVFGFTEYLAEGRFFTRSDFINKLPVAVIGQELLSKTIIEDGKRYYGYNETLYEVIGIFQKKNNDLDRTVYLNLTYILENESVTGLYYVDAARSNSAKQAMDTILSHTNQSISMLPTEYETDAYGLMDMHQIVYTCAILGAFCNLIIASVFFVTRQRYKVAVSKLCGMTRKDMTVHYAGIVLGIVLTAVTGAVAAQILLAGLPVFHLPYLKLAHYFMMTGTTVITGVIITVRIVTQAQKINISDVLKGV